MRYRDTGDYQNLGVPVDDNLVFFSIILGIILGGASCFVMRMLGYF